MKSTNINVLLLWRPKVRSFSFPVWANDLLLNAATQVRYTISHTNNRPDCC